MSGTPRADGLDLTALLRPRPNLTSIKERIEEHLDNHDGYLAFSGGKDSLVALHLTTAVEPNIPVVFFDSGLEYPQTYEYIADLADAWNLNLEVHRADPPLLTVLADSGEWDHHLPRRATTRALRDILIGAPSLAAHQTHGPGEIGGVRADESAKEPDAGRCTTTLSASESPKNAPPAAPQHRSIDSHMAVPSTEQMAHTFSVRPGTGAARTSGRTSPLTTFP